MNKLWKWQEGQHGTGYSILTLAWVSAKWSFIPFDCYIIKYPQGSYIPPHKDVLKSARHYRLNLVLTHPKGGEFVVKNAIYRSKWINFFRADLEEHSVTKVENGTRYVFSIGWSCK